MPKIKSTQSVFINCPFDSTYAGILNAIVFAVFDCGFVARCALEYRDSGEVRFDKIVRIMRECRYGIHDISYTNLDPINTLPRFNMPLELGVFLGAKSFGDTAQNRKRCLVLDREKYRYQKFISDISGQDIDSHEDNSELAIRRVRDWLRSVSGRTTIPGAVEIIRRYKLFQGDLPIICKRLKLSDDELIFNDYSTVVSEWLQVNLHV